MFLAKDYGPFTNLVASAGSILAMGAAVGLGWRRRTKWEPAEEDISGGPQKVGGLVAAVTIAIIWATMNELSNVPTLSKWSIQLLIATVAALLVYGLLVSTLTYYVEVVDGDGKVRERNIIGGFWYKPGIKQAIANEKVSTQKFLKGTAYDLEAVWTRLSRGLAKQSFVLAYLALTICGTVALACAAIVVGLKK